MKKHVILFINRNIFYIKAPSYFKITKDTVIESSYPTITKKSCDIEEEPKQF